MSKFGLVLTVGVLAVALSLVGPLGSRVAWAQPAEGTLLADLVIPGSAGVGVGFDGTHLYWMDFGGGTLHKITTTGAFVADIPIVGCTATVISWDAARAVFWGARGTSISQITTAGVCTPQFSVAGNLPGNCDTGFGCLSLVDGIDHDPSDDTIWYTPDASQRIYHYTAAGSLIGFFDVNDAPNDMINECGFNYSSGVATGVANIIYAAADGCNTIFKYDKSGLKLGSIVIGAQRHEDMECDDVTFAGLGTDAVWIKDAFDNHIRAFAVAEGTCVVEPVKEVDIDIKPGSDPNSINMKSRGTIAVAILSRDDFDATTEVDKTSLTFGRTGDEDSLAKCTKSSEDVNGDGLLDVVCHFRVQDTGFQDGDTVGILKGKTVDGTPIEGEDSVRILHG